jgi:DNA polymerase-3 subunit gamma/tau
VSTALYNRYRPATFGQVVGQDHVTSALAQALRGGRLHHAYLFSGPRGCGKTSSARILAASLNCVNGPTPEPCGVCDQCVAIRTGSSMDVIEIDAASHGLVDDARDLRERAFFAPASARFKVYVVDEAHMVTAAAFNALLKVVEEPPPFLKFVFATTEPDKVLPTIRSRTHHYAFRLVPPAVLREHLAKVSEAEGVVVEPEVLPLVVRAGAGSVRDAMSVLDQLLAGAGPEGLRYDRAVALLGVTDAVLLDEVADALGARDGAALFTIVDKVVSSGHDPRRFATDLLERLRDLILFEAVPDAVERGLLEHYSPDQADRLHAQATALGAAELSRAADVVHSGLVEMRGTTNPRLLLELVLARALLPAAASDPSALLVRLERLEHRADSGPRPAASPAARAGVSPAPDPGATRPAAANAPARPAPAQPAPPRPTAQPAAPPPTVRPAPAKAPAAVSRPGGTAQPDSTAPEPATTDPGRTDPGTPGPATPSTVAPAAASGLAVDAEGLRLRWDEVLREVGNRSKRALAMLREHAAVSDVRGDEVILAFGSPAIAGMFSNGQTGVLADALTSMFGGTWRVSVTQNGAAQGGGRPKGATRPGPAASADDASDRPPARAAGSGAATWAGTEPSDAGQVGQVGQGASRGGPAGSGTAPGGPAGSGTAPGGGAGRGGSSSSAATARATARAVPAAAPEAVPVPAAAPEAGVAPVRSAPASRPAASPVAASGPGTRRTSGPHGTTLRAVPDDGPAPYDEPSRYDDDAPDDPGRPSNGEEAALALLRTDLGVTVIDDR